MEKEQVAKIVFLDVSVKRCDGKLFFDGFRKATNIKPLIRSIRIPQSHKKPAFQSMAHRLVNCHLCGERYAAERKKILEIGRVNGCSASHIQRIIRKHEESHRILNSSL
jgi:hypothetical protein